MSDLPEVWCDGCWNAASGRCAEHALRERVFQRVGLERAFELAVAGWELAGGELYGDGDVSLLMVAPS